jgi:tRNA U34 5-carboxymethylaminomethyl modifying enzyme MnmG/GidA
MPNLPDEAGIQFQILNRSKGAAVWVWVPVFDAFHHFTILYRDPGHR